MFQGDSMTGGLERDLDTVHPSEWGDCLLAPC